MQNNNLNNQDLLFRISELEEENRKLKQKTKYGLVWEDKPEKVVDDCNIKFPVLKVKEGKKFKEIINDKNKPTNILIEGDNYHALSVLNYTHKNSIDVIYIDPPYNTGNKSWRYNNDYVEKDDSFIHSKWISFIRKRVELAKNLLKEDGVLIFTIDDYEIFSSGLLLDSVFGEKNRMNVLVVENNPRGRTSGKFLATSHEYYLIYSKNAELTKLSNIPLNADQIEAFNLEDDISKYRLLPLRKSGADSRRKDRPKQFYSIYVEPKTLKISLEELDGYMEVLPIDSEGNERVWKLGKDNCKKLIESGDIVVKLYKDKYVFSQKDRIKDNRKQKTVWLDPKYDASSHGSILITEILGKRKTFDYPKSLYAVIDSLKQIILDKKDALVLDFFAGSGTTGHAVLEMNKADDGNRQFILVTNNENSICEEVTFERISRVINGYKDKKGGDVLGLGGNLKYLEAEYIDRTKHTDNMKMRLMRACTEMLCLKENAFNLQKEVKDGDTLMYKIFSGVKVKDGTTKKHLIGIYYDLDDSYLDDMRSDLKNQGDLDKSAYIFSLRNADDFIDDYRKWKGINIEEIPQKILEIYESILKNNSRNK